MWSFKSNPMKQLYPTLPALAFLAALLHLLPAWSFSQCNCPNGVTPSTLVFERNISTSMEETTIAFPQFNPADGTLVCTNVSATITAITRIRIENDELFAADYKISYSRTSTISGPGLNPTLVSSFSKNYGPYHLAESDGEYFQGPDYLITPRDTVLNKKQLVQTINGDITPFLGNGTVNYIYALTTLSKISGGGNYLGGPLTNDIILFKLTYSYCPPSLLSSDVVDFFVKNKEGGASVGFTIGNPQEGDRYIIEMSQNGKDFKPIAELSGSTGSKKYNYDVPLPAAITGKLYFRVKVENLAGRTSYSAIRQIMIGDKAESVARLYPNPAESQIWIDFDVPVKDGITVDILTSTGSAVFNQQIPLRNTPQAVVNLPKLPSGLYFIRTTDLSTSRKYFNRLIIK